MAEHEGKGAQAIENPLAKFDASTLKAMEPTGMRGPLSFRPRNMAEAMELAKLMASSNFVPPHLRGRAGDCLAIVMFADRVEMDPYAVASKTYFVNDRMAFEAQFVAALVNTRAPLVGRLEIEWTGEGNNLVCTVTGTLRGDYRPKSVRQELSTITTKNSPLWKQSPRQQLGYYTQRLWARLHCPEVLLGVYADEEMAEGVTLKPDDSGVHAPVPPRPTRADFERRPEPAPAVAPSAMSEAEAEAANRVLDREYAATLGGRVTEAAPEETAPADDTAAQEESVPAAWFAGEMPIPGGPKPKVVDVLGWAREIGAHVKAAPSADELAAFLKVNKAHLDWFRARFNEDADALFELIAERQAALAP